MSCSISRDDSKKYSKTLYQGLGVYLPLITTNCAVLGVALINVQEDYGVLKSTINGFATAWDYNCHSIWRYREKIQHNDIPKSFQGSPIILITAGLMAMAFAGFAGLL